MIQVQKTRGPIGLDIGRRFVKAAQLNTKRGGRSLHAAAVFPRRQADAPVTPTEARQIADVLTRRGFVGNRFALAAPTGALVSSLLDLPPENADVPREQIVKAELSRAHRLDPGSFSASWSALPASANGGRSSQALAWALRHDQIEPLLDAFDDAGLRCVSIEPTSLALQRACAGVLPDPARISGVADLGASAARLVLLYQGRVVHERSLPDWGSSALVAALSEKLDATPRLAEQALRRFGVLAEHGHGVLALETASTVTGMLEEMVEQVSLSFSFVSHQYPDAELGPLLLTGGGAGVPGLSASLAEGLQLQVVAAMPGVLVEGCAEAEVAQQGGVVSALGLAMRGVGDE